MIIQLTHLILGENEDPISRSTRKLKMMQSFYEELETVMEHDNRAKSKGKVTKFKRTNRQSEEVARKFVIMRRLQLKLENMTNSRHGLNNVFHDTCTNLTTTFKASQSSCVLLPCDPLLPYRSIDGCCNNFLNPSLGKIHLLFYTCVYCYLLMVKKLSI